VSIPDELSQQKPLPLCAGLTTYNALRNAGCDRRLGAVQGIGGLGHLGVQFARTWDSVRSRLGVDAARRSSLKIWAPCYIDATVEMVGGAAAHGRSPTILATRTAALP